MCIVFFCLQSNLNHNKFQLVKLFIYLRQMFIYFCLYKLERERERERAREIDREAVKEESRDYVYKESTLTQLQGG